MPEDDISSEDIELLPKPVIHASTNSGLQPFAPLESLDEQAPTRQSSHWANLSVLLLGVFVSQLDQSLVLAIYGHIASEFKQLDSGFWIVSAYALAQCAVQPLYGKLSDIYSRKSCLLASYVLFTLGTFGVGISQNLGQVIAWRAVQGAGGAGMVSMVSIIITDLVPQREVATIRSYVNVLQTSGRSCGGVVGGLLTQAIGWRWAFLAQVLPMAIAIGLVSLNLRLPRKSSDESRWAKLRRVDFIGAFFLTSTILSIALVLDLGGQGRSWNSPTMLGLFGGGLLAASAYVIWAKKVREPIFPLDLLTKLNVMANYAVTILVFLSQISLMNAVPIYFQVTENASLASAGLYLIPAFLGNTIGGLLSGFWIKHTGFFKPITVSGPILALICRLLILTTWNGATTPGQTLFTFPGGFANGVIANSCFVGLLAGLEEQYTAVAASGLYLCFNLGAIGGISAGSAVSQATIRESLQTSLENYEGKTEIIHQALTDLNYIQTVDDDRIRSLLKSAYVKGFHSVNYLGAFCSAVGFVLAVISQGGQISGTK